MPFWTSLLSSVLLVVSATNSRVHSPLAASMSPVSSHSEVPVLATAAHSGELWKLARACCGCETACLQNAATSFARRESWRGAVEVFMDAVSLRDELRMVVLQGFRRERLLEPPLEALDRRRRGGERRDARDLVRDRGAADQPVVAALEAARRRVDDQPHLVVEQQVEHVRP